MMTKKLIIVDLMNVTHKAASCCSLPSHEFKTAMTGHFLAVMGVIKRGVAHELE